MSLCISMQTHCSTHHADLLQRELELLPKRPQPNTAQFIVKKPILTIEVAIRKDLRLLNSMDHRALGGAYVADPIDWGLRFGLV